MNDQRETTSDRPKHIKDAKHLYIAQHEILLFSKVHVQVLNACQVMIKPPNEMGGAGNEREIKIESIR